jgi:hypothetical protein
MYAQRVHRDTFVHQPQAGHGHVNKADNVGHRECIGQSDTGAMSTGVHQQLDVHGVRVGGR